MRSALALIALAFCTAWPLPQAAEAQEWRASRDTVANLRAGPSTNFEVVGRTEPGRTYYQIGREGGWIKIGNGAWVNDAFVERVTPLVPVPTAAVRIDPPKTAFDTFFSGTIRAVSPSGDLAVFELPQNRGRLAVLDLTKRESGVPLDLGLDNEDLGEFTIQYLGDRYLTLTRTVESRQIIVDLMGERPIYDGEPIISSVIGLPGEPGFDRIVSTIGNSVIFSDPDTFETMDSRFNLELSLGLPQFRSDNAGVNQSAQYARFAGRAADGTPLVLFTAISTDGMTQSVRLADLQGNPRGPLVTLEPGELVFAAFPALDGFLTVEAVGQPGPLLDQNARGNLGRIFNDSGPQGLARSDERDMNLSYGSTLFDPIDIRLRFRDQASGAVLRSYGGTGEIHKVVRGTLDEYVLVGSPTDKAGYYKRFDLTDFNMSSLQMSVEDWLLFSPAKPAAASPTPATAVRRDPPPPRAEPIQTSGVYATRDDNLHLRSAFSGPNGPTPKGWEKPHWGAMNDFLFDLQTLSGRRGDMVGIPVAHATDTRFNFQSSYGFFLPLDGSVNLTDFERLLTADLKDVSFRDQRQTAPGDAFIPASVGRPHRGFGQHPQLAVTFGFDVHDDRTGVVDLADGRFTQMGDLQRFDPDRNLGLNFISDLSAIGGLSRDGGTITHFYVGTMLLSDDGRRLHALRLSVCETVACIGARPVPWMERGQPLLAELVTFDVRSGTPLHTLRLPLADDCRPSPKLRPVSSADDLLYQHCTSVQRIDAAAGTPHDIALSQMVMDRIAETGKFVFFGEWHMMLDGRLLVTPSSNDATLDLIATDTGREVGRFYLYPDESWTLLTTEGFYAAGGGGDRNLVIRQGQREFPINKFRTALYRPDLVYEALRGDPEGLVQAALDARSLDSVLASGEAPEVTLSVTAQGGRAEAAVQLRDTGGGVGTIEWRVNGVVRHRGQGPAPQSVSIDLAEGRNIIDVVARNGNDLIETRSEAVEVTVSPEDSAPPRLFVVAAGVNDYVQDLLDLNYAVSDARRVAEAFEAAGAGLYDEIFTTVLIDDDVTRANLAAVFDQLSRNVRPNDVFVFFLAGHGKTIDGRYYFVPPDFEGRTLGELRDAGLGQSLFADWFAGIPAQKSLLLFDTCDSGSLVETSVGRALGNTVSNELLGNAVGRAILSASSSQGVALEGYEGSGLFTHVLLDSLGTADRDADGLINVLELADEVAERLPSLALTAFGEDQQSAFRPPFAPFQVVKTVTLP